ncbi:hypothetical protein appser11_15660 [Actinobacillus pleuropneumoniae serovar 11 str. 56153]|nr:hypothetical protein appser9_15540 [Actinobacillus pleuropneumoniae serovar 9 str. CVJ13261]EFM98030.1 hypothetical protein appser11_15660 [Actinobacillus pleuropneumoniae serovar 11 str. 56153]
MLKKQAVAFSDKFAKFPKIRPLVFSNLLTLTPDLHVA